MPHDAHGCPACPHSAIGPAIIGSPDVLTNGLPSLRVDDTGTHAACCGPNTWTATKGAATVFINGKAAHRQGDQQKHCGGTGALAEGSPNVMTGDAGGGGGAGGGGSGSAAGSSGGGSGGGTGGSSAAGTGGSSSTSQSGASPSPQGSQPSPTGTEDHAATSIEPDEIEIRIIDAKGAEVGGIAYELAMPDGSTRTGFAGVDGVVKLTGLTQRGECTLRLSSIDDKARKS